MVIATRELGLSAVSRETRAPTVNGDGDWGRSKELERSSAKQCSTEVARMNFLGQDKSHSKLTVKGLSRGMAKPTEKDRMTE